MVQKEPAHLHYSSLNVIMDHSWEMELSEDHSGANKLLVKTKKKF